MNCRHSKIDYWDNPWFCRVCCFTVAPLLCACSHIPALGRFLVRLTREKSNPTFDFLVRGNKFHPYYKARLAQANGEAPPNDGVSGAVRDSGAKPDATAQATASVVPNGSAGGVVRPAAPKAGNNDSSPSNVTKPVPVPSVAISKESVKLSDRREDETVESRRVFSPISASATRGSSVNSRLTPGGDSGAEKRSVCSSTADDGDNDRRQTEKQASETAPIVEHTTRGGGGSNGGGDEVQSNAAGMNDHMASDATGHSEGVAARAAKVDVRTTLALTIAERRGGHVSGSEGDDAAADPSQKLLEYALKNAGREEAHAEVISAAEVANEDEGEKGATEESAETRRANRLKRARLMKGHYKLAVMRSAGQDTDAGDSGPAAADDGGEGTEAEIPGDPSGSVQGSEDSDSSASDLLDFDSEGEDEEAANGADGDSPSNSKDKRADAAASGESRTKRARVTDDPTAIRHDKRASSSSSKVRRGETDARWRRNEDKDRRKRGRSSSRSPAYSTGVAGRDRHGDRKEKSSTTRDRRRRSRSYERNRRDGSRSRSGSRSRARQSGDRADRRSRERKKISPDRGAKNGTAINRRDSEANKDSGKERRGGTTRKENGKEQPLQDRSGREEGKRSKESIRKAKPEGSGSMNRRDSRGARRDDGTDRKGIINSTSTSSRTRTTKSDSSRGRSRSREDSRERGVSSRKKRSRRH